MLLNSDLSTTQNMYRKLKKSFSAVYNKARHATPTTLRLRLHSVAAHAGWRYWPRPRKDSDGRAGSSFHFFATVWHFSRRNTAKSKNSVFWFLAPWAKFGASYLVNGIQVWVPALNSVVPGH